LTKFVAEHLHSWKRLGLSSHRGVGRYEESEFPARVGECRLNLRNWSYDQLFVGLCQFARHTNQFILVK
jgi:hypothetical protein